MYSGDLISIQNNTGVALTYHGTSYEDGGFVPLGKLTQYDVQFPKLWSSDTGRSMTGENKGTLVGIFPKLIIKCGRMSEGDMSAFLYLVNQATTNITYYDPQYQTTVTASFYFNDAEAALLFKNRMLYDEIEIHAIANKRRE